MSQFITYTLNIDCLYLVLSGIMFSLLCQMMSQFKAFCVASLVINCLPTEGQADRLCQAEE